MVNELSTKEKIITEAMYLFASNGYKTVTVRMIASKVGIQNSGLYKHFSSKKAIFDAIVERAKNRFLNRAEVAGVKDIRLATMKDACLSMFKYQTQDKDVVCLRQILLSEMYHDKEMAEIYKALFIDMPINSESYIFAELMKDGYMKKNDPVVLAMELYSPFFLYHSIEYNYSELEGRFITHIDNFIKANFIASKSKGKKE